jgi:hypothetical protein
MKNFRLTYPAHIYASIKAEDLDAAKAKLVEILAEVSNGIIIKFDLSTRATLDLNQDMSIEEVLYPDSNASGQITPDLVEVEDVEG